jgi:DNA-nicking Smr family endonuclease
MKKPPVPRIENATDAASDFRAGVIPLADSGRIAHARPRRKPVPLASTRDARSAPADDLSDHITWQAEPGAELVYLRNGVARETVRRLRRGHWPIQAELDLHGLSSNEARGLLLEFLGTCTRQSFRCVRIIHGKGLRSEHGAPVLKTRVANWLVQKSEVLAFCAAHPSEGGSGAVVVLLKSVRSEE